MIPNHGDSEEPSCIAEVRRTKAEPEADVGSDI